MLAIVNYGLGNIQAIANIYKRLDIPVQMAESSHDLFAAHKIILPGVGAFDWAMTRLNESGMRDVLDELVLKRHTPVLGICVGMQMMTEGSDEGSLEGLGWIGGRTKRFDDAALSGQTRLPHMGWNTVSPVHASCIFKGLGGEPRYYFLHSYYVEPSRSSAVLAKTVYGIEFASSVNDANVYGVQFHPEKSHQWGIQLLKNFAQL